MKNCICVQPADINKTNILQGNTLEITYYNYTLTKFNHCFLDKFIHTYIHAYAFIISLHAQIHYMIYFRFFK